MASRLPHFHRWCAHWCTRALLLLSLAYANVVFAQDLGVQLPCYDTNEEPSSQCLRALKTWANASTTQARKTALQQLLVLPQSPQVANTRQLKLVHFWAEWCAPCMTELPELVRFYRNQINQSTIQQLRFITVNNDPTPEAFQLALAKVDLDGLEVLTDPEFQLYRQFIGDHAIALPATVIVAANGEPILINVGRMNWHAQDLTQKIQQLVLEHRE